MCGFAALFQPGRRFAPELLAGIDRDLFHRGPDSGGQAAEDGWALVFRRLSILDPTPGSDQPMTDPSGRCTMVFNGEIYNYRALRAELRDAGVALRADGDTEAVLHGYLLWGEAVLDRLEGMFALTIVDRARNLALAARDPLGIKPLYMLRKDGVTAFASEMRPFRRLTRPEVDETALADLVTFGWAAGRLSNLRHIDRLPGGTLVTLDLGDGSLTERRYSDPLDTLNPDPGLDTAAADALVAESVEDTLKAHLVSDVGFSLQLSGGVDSSLLSALAARQGAVGLTSYSVSLGGHAFDESPFQRMVADRYGLNHHEVPITAEAYADALPRAVRHMEGPTPHGGCTTLMLLCDRIAHTHKVVLTGEGADEMFGGYMRYKVWRKTAMQERLARLIPFSAHLPNRPPFAGIRRLSGLDAAAYSTVYHDFRAVQEIFPALVPKPGAREAASARFRDFRDRLFAVDQSAYLESLLVRQDKMSMAASVEARVPFVHMPFLRRVNSLPRDLRAPGGETKPLLKRMADRYLPGELVHRRKIGLWLPYHEWFQDPEGAGRHLAKLTAADSRLAAYADRAKLAALVGRFTGGDRSSGLVLQRLVEVELWLRDLEEAPP